MLYIKKEAPRSLLEIIFRALPRQSSRDRQCYSNTRDYAIFNPQCTTLVPTYPSTKREAIVTEYKSRVYLLLYDPWAPIADKTRQYGDQRDGSREESRRWAFVRGRSCVQPPVDGWSHRGIKLRASRYVTSFRVHGILVIISSMSNTKNMSVFFEREDWKIEILPSIKKTVNTRLIIFFIIS